MVAAQGPLREADRQPRLPQDRPRAVRHRGRRVRQPVLQGQGPRLGLPQGPQEARRRPRRHLRPDHDRRRGRPRAPRTRTQRTKAVENHKKWVDAAAALGCHSIRVNTGGNYSPTDVDDRRRGLRARWPSTASKNKINIICENHGGPSSNPDALLALIKAVNKPDFGTLPDFGNFPKDRQGKYTIDIYDAIARMMPYAKGVSAKSYDFDDRRQGDEARLRPDHQDRHRRRLSRLRRHRVRGEPAERARGDQGDQEAARIAPRRGLHAEGLTTDRLEPSGGRVTVRPMVTALESDLSRPTSGPTSASIAGRG